MYNFGLSECNRVKLWPADLEVPGLGPAGGGNLWPADLEVPGLSPAGGGNLLNCK